MNKIMLYVGGILVIIAIILGAVQHFGVNLYGDASNKWYFWMLVAIIGIIGIILAAWSFMKNGTAPEKPAASTAS